METFDESDIVDAANVGMGNLPGDADFITESSKRGFTNFRSGEKLEGDGLVQDESKARYTSPMPPCPSKPRMR